VPCPKKGGEVQAKSATLTRGKHSETVSLLEEGPEEAAPILKQYLVEVPLVRPYFQVTPQASLHEFAAEAPFHPVFRIEVQGPRMMGAEPGSGI
jgi:hypothetical protein